MQLSKGKDTQGPDALEENQEKTANVEKVF
jgi:hypothetical protein